MLTNFQILSGLEPAYNSFWAFSMMVCVIPLINIVFVKLNLIRQKDTKIEMFMEWAKLFLLFFIVFQWQIVFGLILKAGDASEAVFLKYVQASEIYPELKTTGTQTSKAMILELFDNFLIYSDTQPLDELVDNQKVEEKNIRFYEKQVEKFTNRVGKKTSIFGANTDQLTNTTKSLNYYEEKLANAKQKRSRILELIQYKRGAQNESAILDLSKEEDVKDFSIIKTAVKWGVVHLIVWISSISKEVMMTLRDGVVMIFYLLGPLIISFSYMFFLGDTDDKGGLNKRSRNFINIVILLGIFPFLYAVLDQIVLILYKIYMDNGRMESISHVIGFFLFYSVLYVSFPFFIYNLNPAGMIGGVFSTLSSLQMSTAFLSVGGISQLSKLGINSTLNTTKSLTEKLMESTNSVTIKGGKN